MNVEELPRAPVDPAHAHRYFTRYAPSDSGAARTWSDARSSVLTIVLVLVVVDVELRVRLILLEPVRMLILDGGEFLA